MKCTICNNKIEMNFLNKLMGTYVKGKAVCSGCQKKIPGKEELLRKVGE